MSYPNKEPLRVFWDILSPREGKNEGFFHIAFIETRADSDSTEWHRHEDLCCGFETPTLMEKDARPDLKPQYEAALLYAYRTGTPIDDVLKSMGLSQD